jgi:lipoprotein-anchoring transpeptidase ErfK/SrfK
MTPEQQRRRDQRAERLRRDRMRRARQRAVLVIGLVVVAIAGAAFALRPAASHAPAPGPTTAGATTATASATRTAGTSAGVVASRTVETSPTPPVTKKPAKPTVEATRSATTLASVKPLKPAPGVKTIIVDKSDQQVTLYTAKGTPVDTFRCASGITYPRIGTYHVYGHTRQSFSLYDDTTFFYFTQFVKSDKGNNIGFHSIPQHPNGTLAGALGKPVSHGCVRLSKDKAKFVYTWAATGTRVVVRK